MSQAIEVWFAGVYLTVSKATEHSLERTEPRQEHCVSCHTPCGCVLFNCCLLLSIKRHGQELDEELRMWIQSNRTGMDMSGDAADVTHPEEIHLNLTAASLSTCLVVALFQLAEDNVGTGLRLPSLL